MFDIFINNWAVITANTAVVLLVIVVVCVLLKQHKYETAKLLVLSLVIKAEKELGSKTGVMKRAKVIEEFYSQLPWIIRVLFSVEDIDKMIDTSILKIKEFLSSPNNNLLGYESENNKNQIGVINNFEIKG